MKIYRIYDLSHDSIKGPVEKKIFEVKVEGFNDIKLEDVGIPFVELMNRDKYRFTVEVIK